MIYYTRHTGQRISVPCPMGYKMPPYKVRISNSHKAFEKIFENQAEHSTLSDFICFELDGLDDIPNGQYEVDVNDGYSVTMLTVRKHPNLEEGRNEIFYKRK